MQNAAQPLWELFLRKSGCGGFPMIFLGAVVEGLNQMLFGGEVVVGIAQGDTGLFRDEPHRRLVVSVVPEQAERGVDDERPRLISAGLLAFPAVACRTDCGCAAGGAHGFGCMGQAGVVSRPRRTACRIAMLVRCRAPSTSKTMPN